MGKREAYGYGRLFSGNRKLKAHRVFFEVWIEAVPRGLFVRHGMTDQKCIGHACCFPFHLRLSPNNRKMDIVLAPSETYTRKFEMFSQITVMPSAVKSKISRTKSKISRTLAGKMRLNRRILVYSSPEQCQQ
jgi:hypothetical protein